MNLMGLKALGYTQVTVLTSAVGVGTIPAGTENVLLQAETQDVRYRDDGTPPTAAIGMILAAKTMYSFTVAEIARMSFIESAATAKLNISFYGRS
jgi:hypothetical protein